MKGRLFVAAGSLFALAALLASGCSTQAYCFEGCNEAPGSGGSGGAAVAGRGGAAGGINLGGNGQGGGIMVGNGGKAGAAGKGGGSCSADLTTDIKNCGSCGNECDLAGAFAKCVSGKCAVESCAPGREDLDKNPNNGCEYACTPTTPDTEVCDEKDNDCNGKTDEGFDLQTDIANCGSCGNSCAKDEPNAQTTACVKGACSITKCADGFADVDKIPSDGCEYACPVFPPKAETCDGTDEDCDGVVDNGNPGGGEACTEACPGGACQGVCAAIQQCAGNGTYICTLTVGPTIEVCDGLDNDCNGTVDDGFDTTTDLQNCGGCGKPCSFDHATASCVASTCTFVACDQGFADLDPQKPGCEYQCPQAVPGVEICDGIDNDCDGKVDADDDDLVVPTSPCNVKAGTLCAGTTFTCHGADGFRCDYATGVEVDADGNILPSELVCDGVDGNCDGQADETFPSLGKACTDGQLGICAGTGTFACNDTHDGVSCTIETNGGTKGTELCNGLDDDCDGVVDDDLPDTAFAMATIPGTSIKMDLYEASHADATTTKEGVLGGAACSNANVLPWVASTFAQAGAACAARGAGYRLCTAGELKQACDDGNASQPYPYGTSYQPTTCNGADAGSPAKLAPTGSFAACVTTGGFFDLSGNATEWSSTKTGTTGGVPNHDIYQLGGGSFDSPPEGLKCSIALAPRASEVAVLDDVGFRCCKD